MLFLSILFYFLLGFESGGDIKQLLVDAALAHTMECPVEVFQRFVDIFFGALHGRQAARVLARQRLASVILVRSSRLTKCRS